MKYRPATERLLGDFRILVDPRVVCLRLPYSILFEAVKFPSCPKCFHVWRLLKQLFMPSLRFHRQRASLMSGATRGLRFRSSKDLVEVKRRQGEHCECHLDGSMVSVQCRSKSILNSRFSDFRHLMFRHDPLGWAWRLISYRPSF